MKIGIVVRRWSARGGLEQNVSALARFLAGNGHSITVVAQRIELEVPGIEVVPIRISPLWPEAQKIQRFSVLAGRAVAALGFDVSFASGHVAGVDVVRLEGGLTKPYFRARPEAERASSERAAARIEAQKLERAKRVLALSDADARSLEIEYRIAREKIVVVRNGIDLAHHHLPPREARIDPKKVIAFIGSGWARKGLAPLIAALEGSGIRLRVAGEDREADRYRALARSAGVELELLGRVDDVRPLLHGADLLALPSLYDPFGLAVLEGLAAGLPVVVTRQVGASEIVPFQELVAEGPDPSALRVAIDRGLALSEDPRTRVIARRAAEAWPIDASFASIEDVLRSTAL